MFSLGFSTIGCPDYDIDQVIDLATSNGLTGVELRFLHGTVDLASLEEFQPDRIGETRLRFTDQGLNVVCVDTSVRLISLDAGERRQQFESARTYVGIAEGLGAKYIRVFGGPIPEDQDRNETLDAIARGLRRVSEEASARGVQSLLETHDDMSTSASVIDLYERGVGDNLGILWDTLHTYRHGESPEFTWSQIGDRVRHVHVKDSVSATAERFDFALLGEGTVPIPAIIGVLNSADYGGFVHFEWEKGWHPEIAGPEIAIPHFAKYMAGLS